MKKTLSVLLVVLIALSSVFAQAATETKEFDYPKSTIEFIVPAAAGAALDNYTRAFNGDTSHTVSFF